MRIYCILVSLINCSLTFSSQSTTMEPALLITGDASSCARTLDDHDQRESTTEPPRSNSPPYVCQEAQHHTEELVSAASPSISSSVPHGDLPNNSSEPAQIESVDQRKLFCGNLPFDATLRRIAELFGQFGDIEDVRSQNFVPCNNVIYSVSCTSFFLLLRCIIIIVGVAL